MSKSEGYKDKAIVQDGEISLKDIFLILRGWWSYLLSKRLVIAIGFFAGAGIGLIYAYSKEPLYVAELTFVLEDSQPGGIGGSYSGLASQLGIDLAGGEGGSAFVGQNLFALMKSRSMIEKALLNNVRVEDKSQTLAEFYIEMNGLREKWADNPKLKDIKFPTNIDPSKFSLEQNSVMNDFHNSLISDNLFVDKQDKKSSLLSIRVTSKNELFSKYFTEVLAKEVSDFYIETKTKKSAANVAILQHQADSIRRVLNSSIRGVAASVDANPNPNLARAILKVPSQRGQVDIQASQVIFSQLLQNLEIAKMSLRKEMPLIQVIDRPILPLDMLVFGKTKGFILGAIVGIFITIIYLLSRKLWEDHT